MATDYEALAKQFGGSVAPAAASGVDYEALAKQFGGSAAAETPAARQNVQAESLIRRGLLQPAAELLATGQGISKGVGNVMFGGQRLLGQGLQALGANETGQALIEDAARRKAMEEANIAKYREVSPTATAIGETGGEILATLPVGGVIAKGVGMVPGMAPLAQSIRTGGFSSGLPKEAGRIANLASRATGGAVVGGASSALINPEDTETGAVIGAAAPLVLPTVGRYVATAGGKIVDAVTGKAAKVEAGKIMREAAGDTLNQLRAANGVAPMDINALQASYGIDNDVYKAFVDTVMGKDTSSALRVLKDTQKLDQINALAKLAGGSTDTEIVNNIGQAKRVLNAVTTPIREDVFAKVAQTNQEIPALAAESKALRKEAAAKVNDVRRFAAAQGRAINPAEDNLATDYLLGKLAGSADEAAGKAAVDSLAAGAGARTAEAKLAEMAQAGVKPIAGPTIAAQIDAIANQPGVRADDVQRKALLNLRDKFVDISAPSNGIVDAEDIYQVRKTAINDAINKALSESGYDPKAQTQRLAGLLGDVRGLIDDAIKKAGGGADWDRYLSTFATGRSQLDQRAAAGQLMNILEKDPQKYVDIVKGKDPKFVEDLFGPGNKNIMQAMGGQRPRSPMVKLLEIADDVERDLKLKGQVKEGVSALTELKQLEKKSWVKFIPGFVGYKTAVLKKTLETLEGRVGEETMSELVKAVRSGKSMNELLDTLPAEERIKVVKAVSDLVKNNATVQRGITSGSALSGVSRNELAPQQQNQNALAR